MWCWSGGRGILRKLSLCYSIVSYYNGAQWYEQVGRLYRGLILLGFALFHPSTICIEIFLVTFFSFPISEPLTWLNNQCPLVLWHCWLGHLTLKIVSEMTCNVSSETLNRTIPAYLLGFCEQWQLKPSIFQSLYFASPQYNHLLAEFPSGNQSLGIATNCRRNLPG